MNLLKFLPIIIEIQKKFLNIVYGSVDETELLANSLTRTRTYMTTNTTLELKANTQLEAEKVTKSAKQLLTKHIKNPDRLLTFVEAKGTPVIKAPFMDTVLSFIGEGEGFLTPTKGFKALFLTLMINILSNKKVEIGFKTPEMFVMRDLPVNVYLFAHQFHHWIAFKKKLPGYEEKTLSNFKNIWILDPSEKEMSKMSIDDILSVKDAIARDNEAIEFVKQLSRELVGSKKKSNQLLKEGSITL